MKNSIQLASEMLCESISIPPLGSGANFGFPKKHVATSIFTALEHYVMEATDISIIKIRKVRIMIIDPETVALFEKEFLRRYSKSDVIVSHNTPSNPNMKSLVYVNDNIKRFQNKPKQMD